MPVRVLSNFLAFGLTRGVALLVSLALLAPAVGAPIGLAAGASDVDDVIAELAQLGIAVYADASARQPLRPLAGPPSAMALTRWQVQNLLNEVNDHDGYEGAQFDAVSRMPKNLPPFSYFVAAWVKGQNSATARYAHRIMGDRDWKQAPSLVYPLMVMVLFAADASRGGHAVSLERLSGTPRFEVAHLLGAPADAASGPCSAISTFISGILDNIYSALKASGNSFWAKLWNGVLQLAQNAVGLAGMAIQAVIPEIAAAATIIAAVSLTVSMLHQWHAKIVANPGVNRFSAQPGKLTVVLDTGGSGLPDEISTCMDLVGANFDSIKTEGAPVAWNQIIGIPELATQQSRDNTIQPDNTATLSYLTGTEPPPSNCSKEVSGAITVKVRVIVVNGRQVWERLWNTVTGNILSGLTQAVATILEPALLPLLNGARDKVMAFQNPEAVGSAVIIHHETPTQGCQPQNPNPPGAPGNGNGNNGETSGVLPDACSLLTDAEASTALGESARSYHGRSSNPSVASGCFYGQPGFENPNQEIGPNGIQNYAGLTVTMHYGAQLPGSGVACGHGATCYGPIIEQRGAAVMLIKVRGGLIQIVAAKRDGESAFCARQIAQYILSKL
jgi:hypothetical protein